MKTLPELVAVLQQQNTEKRDMVVPHTHLRFKDGKLIIMQMKDNSEMIKLLDELKVTTPDVEPFDITDGFSRQIAAKLEIPMPYFDRMKSSKSTVHAESILDTTVNHWMALQKGNFLVRTFVNAETGTRIARAFLGDRYRVLDNIDILFAALEAVKESGVNIKIESCDLTDTRMYVRFIAPDVVIQSPELLKNYRVPGNRPNNGDTGITAGFILSNSETGHGSTMIAPRLIVNACTNGMIFKADAQKQVHLGGRLQEFSQIDWSQQTREKNIELIISQIRDAVKMYLNPEYLGKAIDSLVEDGTTPLQHPIDAITNVGRELAFSDEKQKSLLEYFMQGGDYTGFGVSQAITFFAHAGTSNADERFDLESVAVDFADASRFDKQIKSVEKKGRKTMKTFSNN